MSDLDITGLISKLDTEDMLGYLRNFPNDFSRQMEISEEKGRTPDSALCLGMGGSAAAGDFLASLADSCGTVKVNTWRNYGLPNWIGDGDLLISTSYSGNTEETLDSTSKGVEKGIESVVISSGGLLSDFDKHVQVPSGQPPRSAFGHLFGALLRIAVSRGIIPTEETESLTNRLHETVKEFDFENNPESPTISIAKTLLQREIGIVAAPELNCAGIRFVNQLNENSGVFARSNPLPEMNHNEIIAWTDEEASENQALIFLTWSGMNERVSKRIDWMMDSVEVEVAWQLHCEGESLLEAMLYSCVAMDWISCAIAILRGKDPSAIGAIQDLKTYLSQ
ncbi:MAG: hypothetical protein CMA77_05150 [Euryarchaeota archaeon]|nr:hypothetical protein [Euryarchaeota archaeon]|tara:strand:- start:262 stop:1272 length:1011 start_codon:yes stop_codon:yes gene_type:complete